jgi:hypothetical protein
MTGYWAISPYESKYRQAFDQCWNDDRQHGTIAIRWSQAGGLSGLSRAEIESRLIDAYGVASDSAVAMLWNFYNSIEIGDIILARLGRKFCIGIGTVTRPAYFDLNQGRTRLSGLHPSVAASFLDVGWSHVDMRPVREWFTIGTVSRITEEKYRRLFL